MFQYQCTRGIYVSKCICGTLDGKSPKWANIYPNDIFNNVVYQDMSDAESHVLTYMPKRIC